MQVVVITGASSGIGRATALAFARTGAGLVLASRSQEALRETMELCRDYGSDAHLVAVDVTDEDAVRYLARVAAQTFGRIDVWINNAGVLAWGSVDEVPMSDFRRVIQTNLVGYVHGARAVLPYFRGQGHGILIDNVSMLGALPAPYAGAYVAAKHAVRGFDAVLRQELLLENARDIHVCTLMPGTVDTPLIQHASNPAARVFTPLPPIDSPERVAAAMVDLTRRPRREVYLGANARTTLWRHRLSPDAVERRIALLADRRTREPDTAERPSRGTSFLPPPPWQELTRGGWRQRRHPAIEKATGIGLAAVALWRFARRLAR